MTWLRMSRSAVALPNADAVTSDEMQAEKGVVSGVQESFVGQPLAAIAVGPINARP